MTTTIAAPIETAPIASEAADTAEVDVFKTDAASAELARAIDALDSKILELVRRRVEITRRAGVARLQAGLPRITQHGEMDSLRRYEAELGREGVGMALVLMRLGRGGIPARS